MLTADAFGVLPPIAKLSPSQAMYHFLSGFTARVAGTEKGLGAEPEPTFSTCFGAPFMPLHPSVYGNLLRDLIAKHDADCWLVNTGWTGGPASAGGKRMPIKLTRALLATVLDGSLAESEWRVDPMFAFRIPAKVAGVDPKLLNPRDTWKDKAAYDAQAKKLAGMFRDNFKVYVPYVDERVLKNADQIASAAG
jgi:phosphoenolpyruvate carboxykinase (ATP)